MMDSTTTTTANGRPKAATNLAEIHRALKALFDPGHVVELRALVKSGRWQNTISGYFTDRTKLAASAIAANPTGNVYITLNPVTSDLLSRRCNRAEEMRGREPTTNDSNIDRRRWLLIDLDAQRPSGISATDAEHDAAIEKAREINVWLTDEQGWPPPIFADSGNGAHLLYRVDLPADDGGLVQRCLAALAKRFDDDTIHVDKTVYNPARICKLYGTVARKGDDTPDRPHRLSRLLNVPASIEVVTTKQLEALAGKPPEVEQPRPQSSTSRNGKFDLAEFVGKNAEITSEGPYTSHGMVYRWKIKTCPFCGESDGGAVVMQRSDGAACFKCQHNRCVDKSWKDFREHFEPGYRDQKRRSTSQSQSADAAAPEAPPLARALTDMGNAERFSAQHGADVRFIHLWQKWLIWNGRRWRIDDTGDVVRKAKATARKIYVEAGDAMDPKEQEEIAGWAMKSQTAGRLDAMLKLAKSEQPIPIAHDSLDADPWLLNCENGTVNLRTAELQLHSQGDLLTKTTGVEYLNEPGADAVLWAEFLQTIFAGDAELIAFVQRLFGSAIVGDVFDHVLPILWGGGANGKSVLIETIMAATGDYAFKAPASFLIAKRGESHPTELADLHGRRLVAITETGDGQRLDERLVKELTGGDTIRARRMREDFWQFKPSHLAVMVTNHKPVVRGTDHGLWRRLRLVPFTVTIHEAKQDKQLPHKLRAELPAILRWLVQGCLDWQRNGLAAPSSVMAATEGYKSESDTFAEWFGEFLVVDRLGEVKASRAWQSYVAWCDENRERKLTRTMFGKRIGERISDTRTSNGTWYLGIRFQSDDQQTGN